ncbi:DDE superfamily endonuclease, partial [Rhizoctonia solani]
MGLHCTQKKGDLFWLELFPWAVGKNGHVSGGGLTSEGYAKQITNGPLNQFLADLEVEQGHKILVVEDGAAAHRGIAAQCAQKELGIEQLPHSSNAPDLNPIEPLWNIFKKRVFKIPGACKNLDKLWKAAKMVWDAFTEEGINKYTDRMDAHVEAVKVAKGSPTEF